MKRNTSRDEHKTIQVPNHSFVDVCEGHLSVTGIHNDVKEDAVEGEERLEVVV